jgi:hypothetical protein
VSFRVFLVVVEPETDGADTADCGPLLYCDECRSWGEPGTTHLCGKNWRPRLTDVLADIFGEEG